MQVHIVKQMPSVKAGYVDPQAIAQTNFNYPKWWTIDAKELAAAKTLWEKERIRTVKLREESLKVVAYIALAFKDLQQHSTIWLPYCRCFEPAGPQPTSENVLRVPIPDGDAKRHKVYTGSGNRCPTSSLRERSCIPCTEVLVVGVYKQGERGS